MRKIVLLLNILLLSVATFGATEDLVRIDFENGMPAGWTQEFVRLPMDGTADEGAYLWSVEQGDNLLHPQGCTSGNHRLVARNSRQQEMRFVTRWVSPVMNLLDAFQPQLTFSHAEPQKNGYSDTLKVYYRTSASDYWHLFPQATFQRNALWKEQTLQLVSANATYQIAFEITENMGYGVVLDDIAIHSTSTCQDVKNLQVSERHAHDVLLSWDVTGAYDHFEVILASAPIKDFSSIDPAIVLQHITDGIFNPEITLTNLQPEQAYYVYVRSACDGSNTEYTAWVGTTFETLTTLQLPYTENFNSVSPFPGSKTYGKPTGWTIGSSDDAQVPFVYMGGNRSERAPFSIDSTAYFSFSGTRSSDNQPIEGGKYVYAATPEILVSALWGVQISFWVTAYDRISLGNSHYAAELLVGVMTDPTDFSTFTPLDTVRVETAYMFKRAELRLLDYFGQGKFIAFVSRAQDANAIYIDNLTISYPQVATPTHVSCHHVSSTGFTISADARTADSWNLRVATSYHRDGNVPEGDIIFEQTDIFAPSFNLSAKDGSLAGRTLLIYTQAVRNGQTSAWSYPITLRVPAAMPTITDLSPYTESFEPSSGEIALSTLAHELRLTGQPMGAASVFYPLSSINPTYSAYPRITSVAPNAVGSHIQLCGTDAWFVLPEATNDIKDLKMVFSHATNSSNSTGKLTVGVMTDPYNLSTFTPVASFSASTTTYNRCLVSFDAYSGGGKFIAFRSDDAGNDAVSINLIDEIVVSLLTDCREAGNIDTRVHARSADISWNGGGMKSWKVGLSQTRSMLKAAYQVVTSPKVRFTELQPQTTYYFTIQTICGTDTLGTDGVTYSFTTPQGLPIEEDFVYSSLPAGWRCAYGAAADVFAGAAMEDTQASIGWQLTNKSDLIFSPMSGYVARAYVTGYDYYHWFVSPMWYVDAEEGETVEFTFSIALKPGPDEQPGNAGTDDKFIVVVSEDGGRTWKTDNATIWSNDGNGQHSLNNDLPWNEAQTISLDFTKYVGKTIQVAFYAESAVDNTQTYIIVDNISLRVKDAQCGGLSRLRADANSNHGITVTWLLGGINPKPAVIQVSADPEFLSLVYADTIAGNTVQVSGLQPSTTYYVRGHQACQNDLDWTVTTVHTQCESVDPRRYKETFSDEGAALCWTTGFTSDLGAGTAPQREYADAFGAVLAITKPTTNANESDGAYAISPELQVEDTISKYQVVFSAGTFSQSPENTHRLTVGVVSDPADPGYTFSPISEVVVPYADDSTAMRTFVISLEDYAGDIDGHFGRYIMFLSEAGTDSTNYIYIDNIFVEPFQRCLQIFDLEADSTFVDGAVLRWTGNGAQYELLVSDTPILPDTATRCLVHTTVSSNTYTVYGLRPTTKYYAYVCGLCDDGGRSRWSSATVFTTTFGVPYLEPFAANSMSAGLWQTAKGQWVNDSIKSSELDYTANTDVWELSRLTKNGIVGIEDYNMQFAWYWQNNAWLISPVIDMSKTEPGVVTLTASVAMAYNEYSNDAHAPQRATEDRLGVSISTDNGVTWHKNQTVFWACDSVGTHYYNRFGIEAQQIAVDVTPYVGQSVRLAFYHESGSATRNIIYLDSVALSWKEAVCLGVQNLQFVPVSDSTARASWYVLGSPEKVTIELSDYADFSHIIQTATTTQSSYDFRGLQPSVTYYVRITQDGCATSVVKSLQMPFVAPFIETFNTTALPQYWTMMTGSAQAAFAGTLPTITDNYSSDGWKIINKDDGLPANHLAGELSNITTACTDQWLVSPEIGIRATDTQTILSFDLALTAHNSNTASSNTDHQEFRVLISTDNGATWNRNNQWLFANTADAYRRLDDLSATGERIELDMSRYAGQRVRIALYKTATQADNSSDVHIANLRLAMPCSNPKSLVPTSVDFTSVSLAWQGQTALPTIVEYALTADFAHSLRDTVNNGNTHTISGLTQGTNYFVRVYQLCADNQESDYSNVLSLTTTYGLPYIESFGSTDAWSLYRSPIASSLTEARPEAVVATYSKWKIESSTTVLGAPHAYSTYDKNYSHWLVSPVIDLTAHSSAETIVLQFAMALTTTPKVVKSPAEANRAANEFSVLVSVDAGDSVWTDSNRWRWASAADAQFTYADIPASGQTYQLDFARFAGHKIRIALVHTASKSACINVNNLLLSAGGSNCFGVQNITVNSVDTAAHITLKPADNASRWEVAYGVADTPLAEMKHFFTNSTDVVLPSLSLSTLYTVYARSICAEGDTSAWSDGTGLQTPQGIPYTVPFDSTLSAWRCYIGDVEGVFAGTKQIQVWNVDNGWKACAGTYAFAHNHVACANSAQNAFWLVSPIVNLMPEQGDKELYLGIDLALTETNGTAKPQNTRNNSFYIAVSLDDGKTWSRENAISWGNDTLSADYLYASIPNGRGLRYYFNFTRYAGKAIRIAFVQGTGGTNSYNFAPSTIHIANAELEAYNKPCFGAADMLFASDGGTVECTIVPNDTARMWQYVYGEQGVLPNAQTLYTTSDKVFSISGLRMGTNYDVYVRSLCGEGDTSVWTGPFTFQTDYGVPYSHPLVWGSDELSPEWTRWQGDANGHFVPVELQSGWRVDPTTNNAFAEPHTYINLWYSAVPPLRYLLCSPMLNLTDLTSETIEMQFDMALTAGSTGAIVAPTPDKIAGQQFKVLVSTDNRTTWQEAGVWNETADADYSFAAIPVLGRRYTVDLTRFAGQKVYVGFYGECLQTETNSTLHIKALQIDTLSSDVCTTVSGMVVKETGYHTAMLEFHSPSIKKALAVQYVCLPEGSLFSDQSAQAIHTNTAMLTDLEANLTYDVYARLQCADSVWTGWSEPMTFSTLACEQVTQLKVEAIGLHQTILVVDTDEADSAFSYQAYMAEHNGVLVPAEATTSTNRRIVIDKDLQHSTLYDIYVRKICQPGDTSEWSGPFLARAPYGIPYSETTHWQEDEIDSTWTRYQGNLDTLKVQTLRYSGWRVGKPGWVFPDNHTYINTNNYSSLLVSPWIDLTNITPGTPVTLTFDMALTASSGAAAGVNPAPTNYSGRSFSVLISRDSTWTKSRGWTWSESGGQYKYSTISTDGDTYELDLSAYAGQVFRLGFYLSLDDKSGGDNILHLQNISLDTVAIASCRGLRDVAATQITSSSALLTWRNKSANDAPIASIEVATDPLFEDVIISDTIRDAFSYPIEGLLPANTYYLHARQLCDDGGATPWTLTSSFTTAYALPYQEDYNNYNRFATDWHVYDGYAPKIFAGETFTDTRWSTKWTIDSLHFVSFTDPYLKMYVSSSDHSWAVSPSIDLTQEKNSVLLTFDAALTAGDFRSPKPEQADLNAEQYFMVVISTDNGATWQRTNATIWTNAQDVQADYPLSELGVQPTHYMLDLSAYTGHVVRVAFYAEAMDKGKYNHYMVDNLQINRTTLVQIQDTICSGDDYGNYGFEYPAEQLHIGNNHYRIISPDMTHITDLTLVVNPVYTVRYQAEVCEGERFTGYGFDVIGTTTTTYRRYVANTDRCDSIYLLDLTVIPTIRTEVIDSICAGGSFSLNGQTYRYNAIAFDTLSSALSGCDSITMHYITFTDEKTLHTYITKAICQGEWYSDGWFTQNKTGYYRKTDTSTQGCDSTVTLHLFVADENDFIYDSIYSDHLPYIYDGEVLLDENTPTGFYDFPVESAAGICHITLRVHVLLPTDIDNTHADIVQVAHNPIRVGEPIHLILPSGLLASDMDASLYNAMGQLVYHIEQPATTLPPVPTAGIYTLRLQTEKKLWLIKVLAQ